LSRTFKWALALLVAACISVPAVAFAAPGLSDLSQTDAASEAANLPDEGDGEDAGGDTAAMPPASNPAQEDGAPGADGAPEADGTSTADGLASPQNDLDADTDDAASVLAETEDEPGENVEADAAVSSADEDPDIALRGPANRAAIYVNGSSGNDANPGTEAAPVKTFAKAKELLEASGGDVIYVLGALQVSGDAGTWELGGKTLARGNGYHGELINVAQGASVILQDIVLDGRSGDGQTGVSRNSAGGGGALVGVYGGTLTIGEGAILQNNSVESRGNWYPEGGGAVFANRGTVNVEGGTVRNNEAVQGGGIYGIYNAAINMSSGTITGNRAIEGASSSLQISYGGNGGGICAANGTSVNLSGGTIEGNSAFERGGGISMGTFYASEGSSPVLTMTGGTISGNTAGSAGGGIFVQAGYSASGNGGTPTYAIAYITGGNITNNSLTATGDGSALFGGGGIYVNGYSSAYSSYHNGELYLTNVEVSGNNAAITGGGYAACPVSVTEINLTNGAAFYGNTTDTGNARELYIEASLSYGAHSGDPVYEISPSMLGGGAYKWVYDSGTEVPLDRLKGVLHAFWGETLSLSNDLAADDPGVQKALGLAAVHITGNTSATRGGGIGSNGSVFIGESVETTEISVSKTWDDGNDIEGLRPESVKVELYRDGEYVGYQTMTPDKDGTWSMTFENLPKNDADGHEYTYTVAEREVPGYTPTISGDAASGFSIVNTVTVSVSGTKVWNDADDRDGMRPDSITIILLRDGQKVGDTVVTADDNWSFTFDGLAKYDADGREHVYTIAEDAVEGYSSTIEGDAADGFIVTNTKDDTPAKPSEPTPNKPPARTTPSKPLPAAGDGSASPMALAAIACACIVAARAMRRRASVTGKGSSA